MHATDSVVRLQTKLADAPLQIRKLDGRETINQLFEFDVLAVVPGETDLDVDDLVSSQVALLFDERDPDAPDGSGHREMYRRYGIVVECRDHMLDEEHRAYQLRIVPRFWMTSLVETLDIFMGLSLPDIIRKKLGLIDLAENQDFEFRLQQTYDPLEFVVQFKETDLGFLSRLVEHWGVSFFFEHRDGRDVLVFTDHNEGFCTAAHGGMAHFTRRGERTGIYRLQKTTRAITRLFVQRDYNYRKPATDLLASTELPDGFAGGVIEYGGHFKTTEQGGYLSKLRAQEAGAKRQVFEGESMLDHLHAGAVLEVEGHPRGDAKLLLTEVRHRARQAVLLTTSGDDEPYHNSFDAILESVPFRPPRNTPKPRVTGVLTGIIDAEQNGKYAEVDDQGRYKVKFMFDTSGAGEGKASRSVRMMQPHAGPGYGMHFPLRPGVEVLITFVDGDPDRPIIAGTVPNPETASPVVDQNLERNVIRTGAGNELNIDDTEGSERIKLTTPYKSTTFQMGSPNAGESGAHLATFGAWSQVASDGIGTVGAVKASVSSLCDFATSSWKIDNVGKPAPMDIVGAGFDVVIKGLYELSAAVISGIKNGIDGTEKLAVQDAAEKLKTASDLQKAAAPEPPTKGPRDIDTSTCCTPEVQSAVSDWTKSLKARDDAFLGLIGVMEDRNGIIAAERDEGANQAFDDVMQNDVIAAQADYDAAASYDPALDTTTPEADKPPAGSAVQKQALDDLMAACPEEGGCTLAADVAACQAAQTNLDAARQPALDANNAYATMLGSNAETLTELTKAEYGLDILQKAADVGDLLLFPILQIVSILSGTLARGGVIRQWRDARDDGVEESKPRGAPKASEAYATLDAAHAAINKWHVPIFKPQYTYVLGSEHTMAIYGSRDAVMWGEDTMLLGVGSKADLLAGAKAKAAAGAAAVAGWFWGLGPLTESADYTKGTVTIIGGKATRVFSPTKIEIACGKKIETSAEAIDTMARDYALFNVKKDPQGSDAAINVRAGSDGHLNMKVKKNLWVKAEEEIQLRPGKAAKLIVADGAVKVTADGTRKEFEAEVGMWKLAISDEIDMGNGRQRLYMTSDGETLIGASTMNMATFKTDGTFLTGTKVTIEATGDAEIKGNGRVLLG